MKHLFFQLFVLNVSFTSFVFAQNTPEHITLGEGEQVSLEMSSLSRVAVANSKIAQVRILSDGNEILIQALKPGETTLTLWNKNEKKEIPITIYSQELTRLKKEMENILKNIEGIKIEILDSRIAVTGFLYKVKDYYKIEELKQNSKKLINLTSFNPEIFPVLTKHMQEIIGEAYPYVTISFQDQKIVLTGEVSSQDEKDKLLVSLNNEYPFVVDLIKIGPGSQKLIQVDVRLLEISRNFQKQIGLTYPETIKIFSLQDLIQRLAHQSDGSPSLDIFLQLLSEKGYAKILSHPKLVCQNGKEASFMAGGEIPIRIISRITSQISWRSYGMILKITPTASLEQHIHTQISVELSSLDPAHTTDGIPGILSRKLETAVTVKEKETIILSGLLSKNSSESQNKVPFLGDIPVLGTLFQVNRKREDQTELMIIVTPKIMNAEKT